MSAKIDESESEIPAPSLRARLIVVGLAALLALGGAECALRIGTSATPYRVLPANARAEFAPAPGVMPGVTGVSVYSTSPEGIRGRPYWNGKNGGDDGGLKMLVIGGSTAECLYLDDSEAWPAILESMLGSDAEGRPAWIGNVGVSGHGMVEHILVARYMLPQLRTDWTLALVGANDLVPVLRKAEEYEPESEDPDDVGRYLDKTFRTRPLADSRWPARFPGNLASWNLAKWGASILKRYRAADLADGALLVEDSAGLNYAKRREMLRGLPVLEELPDATRALKRFEENLRLFVTAVREAKSRPLLLTQPSVYNTGLSPEHAELLWIAFFGSKSAPRARYATPLVEEIFQRFNDTTLRVCQETGADCLDLARAMEDPERELYYYDAVHFNERGARRVAEIVSEWFRGRIDRGA